MSVDRDYLRPTNPFLQRVYAPTEDALRSLYVYGLFASRNGEQLTYENVEVGEVAVVDDEVWLRTGDFDARRLFGRMELLDLVTDWPNGEAGWTRGFEWFLKQVEAQGGVAFGRERDGGEPFFVTRGVLPDQYCVWVPKVTEVTEAHEKLVTGFERARLAGASDASEKLHAVLVDFVQLVVEVQDGGPFQIVGVQGAKVIK